MSLRSKVLLLLASVFLFFGIIDICIQRFIVYPGFLSLENEEAIKDSKRLTQAIDREIYHLDSLNHDWSAWDDTYKFVENKTKDYIESNLVLSVFTINNLNLLYIIDKDGSTIWGEARELKSLKKIHVKEFERKIFHKTDPLINYNLLDKQLSEVSIKGIYATEQGPMLVTSRPILTSNNEGPIRGSIIMGKFINEEVKHTLARQTEVDFKIYLVNDELTKSHQKALKQISQPSGIFIQEKDENLLWVYSRLSDIQGRVALLLKVEVKRKISAKGWSNIRTALLSIIFASVAILIVVSLLLQCIILSPITKLTRHVLTVKQTNDLSRPLAVNRKDELGTLQKELNNMFEQMSDSKQKLIESNEKLHSDIIRRKQLEDELKASEETFRSVVESSPMGIHMYHLESEERLVFIGANPAANGILGVDNAQFIGKTIEEAFPPLTETEVPKRYRLAAKEGISWQTEQINYPDNKINACFEVHAFQMTPGKMAALFFDVTERKQVVEKLRENEKEYRALTDNIPGMIYRGNPDWYVKMISNSKRICGYTTDEFNSGKVNWLDIIHPDDKEDVYKMGSKLVVKPEDTVQTYRIVSKDGAVLWVEDRKTSLFTDDGNFSGVDGVVFDITERKAMESALKSSQQKLSIHFEQTLLAVQEYDINLKVTEWNPAAERIFGYTKEEAVGRHVGELIVPENSRAHVDGIWEFLIKRKGGEQSINENLTKKGETIICEWYNTPLVDKNGIVIGIASLAQDITERIQAEKELNKAHEELKISVEERTRLVSAIEQSNDNIVITDPEGNIEYVNPAFETNTGYSRSEVLGGTPRILKSGKHDGEFYRNLWETITNGEIWTGNFINKCKDGTFIEESATIFPVVTSEGEIKNFVGVKRDMTEQLNTEKQLRQAQKLDAIGTLASGIAHDFNNILGAIFAYTQLSKRKLPDFPEGHTVAGYLDKIFAAGSRAKELIDQILTFSRKGEYAPTNMDLGPLMKESIRFLRATLPTTISIKLDIGVDLRNVYGDPTQIQQVIMNLCTNASHAMEEKGGTLEITLSNYKIRDKEPDTGNLEPGDALLLTISDTGNGMNDETKQRIFEPFYTTKEKGKGTGLGLSIVHGIVTRHGGTIKVYSEEGSGTRFNIYLPASLDDTIRTEEEDISELPKGSESILLVDDEIDIRSSFKDMLELQGYNVQTISSSLDALNKFKKTPHDYDLIITDYTMPEINGIELSREIHKIMPGIPIILISGLGKLIRNEELESAGIASRYSKPVEFETLIRGVRDVLDGKH